jgi:nitrogen regulatory protein P-II 1
MLLFIRDCSAGIKIVRLQNVKTIVLKHLKNNNLKNNTHFIVKIIAKIIILYKFQSIFDDFHFKLVSLQKIYLFNMKKIEAIIRKTKFEEVKEALLNAEIEWFSYYDVRGVGKMRQERIYRGVVYDTSYIERTMLTIVVRDMNVERTVAAILDTAQTGEIGDGRIFVSAVEDSIRIRTGEHGDISLYDVE